ncbi:MAG TPA: DsbC family protein [Burkholderiaceae bacterium]|nr:DsbC family protein [Burkholderiaceae bacterium]
MSTWSRSFVARASAGLLATLALSFACTAMAQEAQIRKSIAERLPEFPKIDEITKTPIPGLYELRIGTDVLYSDERGEHLIQGEITDTRTRTNLTQARIDKLTAIDFASLPLKDALVWKQGSGARKLVVFADPNCGYCKRFEKNMLQVEDVTVYTFLLPILGGDSPQKARDVWCAKDNGAVWRDWMIKGTPPPRSMGQCDTSALTRNIALGRKYRVTGTPSLVFEDGKRVPGALAPAQVEKQLQLSRGKG